MECARRQPNKVSLPQWTPVHWRPRALSGSSHWSRQTNYWPQATSAPPAAPPLRVDRACKGGRAPLPLLDLPRGLGLTRFRRRGAASGTGPPGTGQVTFGRLLCADPADARSPAWPGGTAARPVPEWRAGAGAAQGSLQPLRAVDLYQRGRPALRTTNTSWQHLPA